MKLPVVTSNDPVERMSLGLHKSVTDSLKTYQLFYKKNTGHDIPLNLLIEEMLKGFMRDDKDFAKYLKVTPATPEKSS